jgi:hypothetical protein
MPIILATQEAEIRRIEAQSQPWANSSARPYVEKNPSQKKTGGVAQGVGPEFKCQYQTKVEDGHSNSTYKDRVIVKSN